jgi:predicted negative regulator of RcsB-dependent stress response
MQCFGSFEQEHPGGIYRLIMETGKILIDVFVVGGIKVFGKAYWSS